MEKLNNDWRTEARLFLAEHIGEEFLAADLYDRFGANMPLHHATRMWVSKGGRIGNGSHDLMRWRCFTDYLRHLNVSFYPAASRTRPTEKSTVVTIRSKTCQTCGKEFFSQEKAINCSPTCSGQWRWVKPNGRLSQELLERARLKRRLTYRDKAKRTSIGSSLVGLTEAEVELARTSADRALSETFLKFANEIRKGRRPPRGAQPSLFARFSDDELHAIQIDGRKQDAIADAYQTSQSTISKIKRLKLPLRKEVETV